MGQKRSPSACKTLFQRATKRRPCQAAPGRVCCLLTPNSLLWPVQAVCLLAVYLMKQDASSALLPELTILLTMKIQTCFSCCSILKPKMKATVFSNVFPNKVMVQSEMLAWRIFTGLSDCSVFEPLLSYGSCHSSSMKLTFPRLTHSH